MIDILLENGANVNTEAGRPDFTLTTAKRGKAKVGIKVEIMLLLKQWGAKEVAMVPVHEKGGWDLTLSGWMWLVAETFTVTKITTVAETGGGN